MNLSKTWLRLPAVSCTALIALAAVAGPPHQPDLVADGNEWRITAFLDDSPAHLQLATQILCFFPDGVSGTHQRYIWVSTSFPDWNGRATQEGDQIFMYGDFQYPPGKIDVGHDSMQWELVTERTRTQGAGHWHEWVEDGRAGLTIGFANAHLVRSGRCQFRTAEEAMEFGRQLPWPVDDTGRPLRSPFGNTTDNG